MAGYSDITVSGVVIKSTPVGEADRRLELLTRERGKITVFARGCRRPTSPLIAFSRTFCFARFQITIGKNNYLRDGDAIDYFDELTKDYENLVYGSYFLEYASYFVQEELESADVLNLLYLALKALLNANLPKQLIRFVYELRMLTINGEAPHMGECLHCRKELTGKAWFHMRRSGAFCEECAAEAGADWALSETAVYTLRYVEEMPLQKLFCFTLKEEVLQEVTHLLSEYQKRYLDATFASLEMLP